MVRELWDETMAVVQAEEGKRDTRQPKPESPPKTRAPAIIPPANAKPKITITLTATSVADLEELRQRLPALTDAEIIGASLALNEMHTRRAQ